MKKFFDLGWLLIPFIIISIYLIVRVLSLHFGFYFPSFLCWFVEYRPDCNTNIVEELKLLALIFSLFNLKIYYDYILLIFDNINNDIFQINSKRKKLHKQTQFIIPIILFISAFIIFKSLFVFKYSFSIAKDYGHINIAIILDDFMYLFRDEYLIIYFLMLDILLWIMTANFFKTLNQFEKNSQNKSIYSMAFSSFRQKSLLREARKNFKISTYVDLAILLFIVILFRFLIPDSQSNLAIQLTILQLFYLYLNISTIQNDFIAS